jgi:hypothetical protein
MIILSSKVENVGEEGSRFILPHCLAQEMTESHKMARHLISSIKALLRGDEMTRFITIKWRMSRGNRFWSSMIFC